MKLIAYSLEDVAGTNIVSHLTTEYGFRQVGDYMFEKGDVKVVGFKQSVRDLEQTPFEADLCVVASRHRAKSKTPSLTAHSTGNFHKAELGGSPKSLQLTDADYLRGSMELLRKNGADLEGFEITREVTHHGPTGLDFPLLFVEVGSSIEQWRRDDATAAAAATIYELVTQELEKKTPVIGFGGPHYAPNFNELEKDYSVGHIMPKYMAAHADKEVITQMVEKTRPKPQLAAVDWKGLDSKSKNRITHALEELDIPWEKTTNLK